MHNSRPKQSILRCSIHAIHENYVTLRYQTVYRTSSYMCL